jgi:hypothetical protein
MATEEKFDKIINILFDESFLHWKEVPTTDFISQFAKKKHKIDWSDVEINFIMTMLINDGYIKMNEGDFSGNNMKMPTYSLTIKGVLMKRKGGFKRTKFIDDIKNAIILYGSIIAFIVSVMTIVDLGIKFFGAEQVTTCCEKDKTPKCCNSDKNGNSTLPKSTKEINIIKHDTVTQPIKKNGIGTNK